MKLANFARILAVSLALSAYSAWVLSEREHTAAPPSSAEPWAVADIPLLTDAEAESLWHQPATLFIDVRPPGDFEVGHIAGALNLPYEEAAERLPSLLPRLEQAGAVVVYCKSSDCGKSLWSAILLRQHGLARTKIYPGGWNEWFNRGAPIARGAG
jgi:rhodanese-related sulfurtransferase